VLEGRGTPEDASSVTATQPLRQRALAGEPLFGTFLNLGSPAAAEVCALSGADWLLIDLEHGMVGDDHLLPMLLACKGTPATPIVRVESAARARIGRVLDLGAAGVMVPQVRSAAEAADVAAWLRYQPGGQRGVALFTRGMAYGARGHADVAARHEELLGIVQVETRSALDEADAIAAIDGVDVLFVGPTDLSHALGVPGRLDDPAYDAAMRRVADAARAHDKAAGVLLWGPADVGRYADAGYTFFAISSEGSILDRAMRSALSEARSAAASGA
jgi:4-hydroxy-2-oxoheptanedioate aldolase